MIIKISAAALVALSAVVAFQAARPPAQDPRTPRDIILAAHRAAGHGGPVVRLSLNGCQLNLTRGGSGRREDGRKMSTRTVLRADLGLLDFDRPRYRNGSLSFDTHAGDARIDAMNRRIEAAAQAEGRPGFAALTPNGQTGLAIERWMDPRIKAPDAAFSAEDLAQRKRLLALARRLEDAPAPMIVFMQEAWIHGESAEDERFLILIVAAAPMFTVLGDPGAPQEALAQALADYAETCAD